MSKEKKIRILLMRFDHIGDWLIFRSVWQPYFNHFQSKLHVELIVSPLLFPIIQQYPIPCCHKLYSWNPENFSVKKPRFWTKYLQLLFKQYDYIINPIHSRNITTEGMIRFPFFKTKKIGSQGDSVNFVSIQEKVASDNIYDCLIPVPDNFHFERDRDVDFVEGFFSKVMKENLLFRNEYDLKFKPNSNSNQIIIAPATASVERNWPILEFVTLIQSLHYNGNYQFILVGTASEKRIGEKIYQELHNTETNIVIELEFGTKNYGEIEAKAKASRLVISHDSSLFHAAALNGIPCVCIASGKVLNRFHPYPEKYFWAKAVYSNNPNQQERTIQEVTNKDVLDACLSLL